MPQQIDIIFNGPPSATTRPELIGVKNAEERTWIERPDGSWALRVGVDGTELTKYAAHAPVFAQVTAFLTQITQTVVVYVTITGGAWAVVSSNTIGASTTTLLSILALHIVLSVGTALGLKGVGNNFVQRLDFLRQLGLEYWPRIEEMGKNAWKKGEPRVSLRQQRFWFWVPILAALVSIWLMLDILSDSSKRDEICLKASLALAFPDSSPIDRVAFDRARYLFDKAGCEVTNIKLR
ncbi:hypothetical protein [Bradyrhizobium sp. McL0615]|uniref:hypothetical protein n=1 Tax=Bradyrhizobium sp. McL0615 TaxID=3415673 RepID=UPI003CE72D8D